MSGHMKRGRDQGFVVVLRALVRARPFEDDVLIRFPGVDALGMPFVQLWDDIRLASP
jgi:hypothetical protein